MKESHKNGLVGLRVLATLGIALYHFELTYPFLPGVEILSTGYLLVEFFFVLSGFLMAQSAHQSKRSKSIIKITIDRIKRLYPGYIPGLILLPLIYAITWFHGNYYAWLADGLHLRSYIAEFFMIQCSGAAGLEYVNGPAWYVSALLLSTPIVAAFIKCGKKYFWLSGLTSIILYGLIWYYDSPSMGSAAFIFEHIPVPILRGLAGMLLGVFTYTVTVFLSSKIQNLKKRYLSLFELIFFVWLIRMCILRESNIYNGVVLIPICGLIILMMGENRGVVSRLFSVKSFAYLAEISYAFYILQSFCSNFFSCLMPDVKQPWVTGLYLIFNFSMAVIVHELWEKPIFNHMNK